MLDITSPVGANGSVNKQADVINVQTLLNLIPVSEGGANPVVDLDGWCLNHTITAISAFQRHQFNSADGRVDPGKKTITTLNTLASGPGTRAVPLPDLDPSELAARQIPQALIWATAAIKGLTDLAAGSTDAILLAALQAHFKITPADTRRLAAIKSNFEKAATLLGHGKGAFRSVSRKQMSADLQGKAEPGYTLLATKTICWTPIFHASSIGKVRPGLTWTGNGFGPKCLSAMVLHEPIHAVDPQANYDEYEWGPTYGTLSADRSLHNAASYPSFAAHVSERSTLPFGPRYGVGRPTD